MRWIILSVALFACNKSAPDSAAQSRQVHPDLHCPEEAIQAGRAPPEGFDAWCQTLRPSGRWVRHGPNITWHPNGQKASFGEYQYDRQYGQWEFYYPTGELERQGSFVGGVPEGTWTAYYPSGEVRSEGEMVAGKEHGQWSYWEQDGRWSQGEWVLGERDGIWVDYDTEDVAYRERTYKSGRMVGMREL